MATASATLGKYRQSPRKVRLVADTIRGKAVQAALNELSFLPKRASLPIKKLLLSAVANTGGVSNEALRVSEIRVDSAPTLRRSTPRARGSMSRINKRSSRIVIVVSDESVTKNKKVKEKKS